MVRTTQRANPNRKHYEFQRNFFEFPRFQAVHLVRTSPGCHRFKAWKQRLAAAKRGATDVRALMASPTRYSPSQSGAANRATHLSKGCPINQRASWDPVDRCKFCRSGRAADPRVNNVWRGYCVHSLGGDPLEKAPGGTNEISASDVDRFASGAS
jgi:hypothetical protein